ncbi:hypothetical protein ACFX2I_009519 [Malus domestica]
MSKGSALRQNQKTPAVVAKFSTSLSKPSCLIIVLSYCTSTCLCSLHQKMTSIRVCLRCTSKSFFGSFSKGTVESSGPELPKDIGQLTVVFKNFLSLFGFADH